MPRQPAECAAIRIGYHMRGEVISVLSLERRYHILSRVSAAHLSSHMITYTYMHKKCTVYHPSKKNFLK